MKKFLEVIAVLMCATTVLSAGNLTRSGSYQTGTITSVQRQEVTEPAYRGGDNPSDAPLQSQYYVYNIALKSGCGTYVGHVESPYDYLPTALATNREVAVRVSKHTLDLDLGYRQVEMNIIHRKTDNCNGQR